MDWDTKFKRFRREVKYRRIARSFETFTGSMYRAAKAFEEFGAALTKPLRDLLDKVVDD